MENLVEELTEDQERAYETFLNFIQDPEEMFMILEGYAGTGKTFLTKKFKESFFDIVKNSGYSYSLEVAAPTHKALRNLEKNIEVSGKTLHRLLGMTHVYYDDKGNFHFKVKENEKGLVATNSKKHLSFFIVDEFSMINEGLYAEMCRQFNQLLEDLEKREAEYLSKEKSVTEIFTESKVKVVFVGDPLQLPPVNEPDSPISRDNSITYRVKLEEVVRQTKENEIIQQSMKVRNNLYEINTPSVLESGENLKIIDRQQPSEDLEEALSHFSHGHFNEDSDYMKILAYTNGMVQTTNQIIRARIYGEGAAPYLPGEVLVANASKFYYREVIRQSQKIGSQKDRTVTEKVQAYKNNDYLTIAEVKNEPLYVFGERFEGYAIRFQGLKDYWGKLIDPEERPRFKEVVEKERQTILEFPRESRKPFWREFYEILDEVDDLYHSYAMTVHKSQGSTYQNTILIMHDIMRCKKTEERNRMIYTALTRTANKCFIVK